MRVTPQGGGAKRGGPRQVPRSPPLKHTTVFRVHRAGFGLGLTFSV